MCFNHKKNLYGLNKLEKAHFFSVAPETMRNAFSFAD